LWEYDKTLERKAMGNRERKMVSNFLTKLEIFAKNFSQKFEARIQLSFQFAHNEKL